MPETHWPSSFRGRFAKRLSSERKYVSFVIPSEVEGSLISASVSEEGNALHRCQAFRRQPSLCAAAESGGCNAALPNLLASLAETRDVSTPLDMTNFNLGNMPLNPESTANRWPL